MEELINEEEQIREVIIAARKKVFQQINVIFLPICLNIGKLMMLIKFLIYSSVRIFIVFIHFNSYYKRGIVNV